MANPDNRYHLPGSHNSQEIEYDLGSFVIQPIDGILEPLTSRLKGLITYPAAMDSSCKYPLVILAHGRHSVTVENYKGLAYLAHHLSSHGYICVSLCLNDLAGPQGTQVLKKPPVVIGGAIIHRAKTIIRTISVLKDQEIVGKYANFNNVGLLGHGRGAEAAARAAVIDAELGGKFGLKALFALAPADFTGVMLNLPFFLLYGNIDGDIADGQPFRLWDRARLDKYGLYVYGMIHHYFSSNWTNEWENEPHPRTLSRPDHEKIAKAYSLLFFQKYLEMREENTSILQGHEFALAGENGTLTGTGAGAGTGTGTGTGAASETGTGMAAGLGLGLETEMETDPGAEQFIYDVLYHPAKYLPVESTQGSYDASCNTLGMPVETSGEIDVTGIDLERFKIDDEGFLNTVKKYLKSHQYLADPRCYRYHPYLKSEIGDMSRLLVQEMKYFYHSSEHDIRQKLTAVLKRSYPGFEDNPSSWWNIEKILNEHTVDELKSEITDLTTNYNQNSHSFNHLRKGLILDWRQRGAEYKTYLGDINVEKYQYIGFRAGQNYLPGKKPYLNTIGENQSLSIILTDINKKSKLVSLNSIHRQIRYPWLDQSFFKTAAASFFLPLQLFAEGENGIDLKHLKSVTFGFDKSDSGSIMLDDIVFSS